MGGEEKLTKEELKEWRESVGWSQERLARELEVSRVSVSNWESGFRPITKTLSLAISKLKALNSGA